MTTGLIIFAVACFASAGLGLFFWRQDGDPMAALLVGAGVITGSVAIGAALAESGPQPDQICVETYQGAYTETDEGIHLCLVETKPK